MDEKANQVTWDLEDRRVIVAKKDLLATQEELADRVIQEIED